jgi:hypothetical protein
MFGHGFAFVRLQGANQVPFKIERRQCHDFGHSFLNIIFAEGALTQRGALGDTLGSLGFRDGKQSRRVAFGGTGRQGVLQ